MDPSSNRVFDENIASHFRILKGNQTGPLKDDRRALGNITNEASSMAVDGSRGQLPLQSPPVTQTIDPFDNMIIEEDTFPLQMIYYDIDAADHEDPQAVTEYCSDIFSNLKSLEEKYCARHDYMEEVQHDITMSMRAILVDWLNEVTQEYRLKIETLHMTLNLIDRFLSKVPVMRSSLQLVGVTCMFIASSVLLLFVSVKCSMFFFRKYEEISPPTVDDFVYITDNTYTRNEVLQMEVLVLNTLEFCITVATPMSYLSRYLRAANADRTVTQLANYLLELTMQEYSFIQYRSSLLCSATIAVALHTLQFPAWTPTLSHYTEFSVSDVGGCAQRVLEVYRNAEINNLQAVREKYSHARYGRVSNIPPPMSLPPHFG